uniref:Uncharacterized protein n=1 Tax=Lepeophtheirus salmonis TaxID=72036 RepID=A0A0K2TFT9_LEPSM
MILRLDIKEAFRCSSLHPSSEHYIYGEFTHFWKQIMAMGNDLINNSTKRRHI